MTIIQAILKVMADAGEPISAKDAYHRIVDAQLYDFKAQDPLGVVTGQIRRHCLGLEFPTAEPKKFFKVEPSGKFAPLPAPVVTDSPGRRKRRLAQSKTKQTRQPSLTSTFAEIRSLQATYRELLKERILRELKKLSPEAFEHFSKRLLDIYGFEDVEVTAVSGDGGIDGYGKLRVGLAHMRVAFQCKRWTKSNVGRPAIDRFRGAIQGEYEQGIFFTTAKFVPAAQGASIKRGAVPVILVDGPSMVDLMIEKQFGVQEEPLSIHTYALDTILSDENDM
jgi:restriction system protein